MDLKSLPHALCSCLEGPRWVSYSLASGVRPLRIELSLRDDYLACLCHRWGTSETRTVQPLGCHPLYGMSLLIAPHLEGTRLDVTVLKVREAHLHHCHCDHTKELSLIGGDLRVTGRPTCVRLLPHVRIEPTCLAVCDCGCRSTGILFSLSYVGCTTAEAVGVPVVIHCVSITDEPQLSHGLSCKGIDCLA